MPIKVLFIFGTRPEAIKLCPVIRHMKSLPNDFDVRVCVTAQHREMLDQVLHALDVTPDWDLDIMRPGQTLYQSTSHIIGALEPIFAEQRPHIVLVQGDTTTTFCGALAAFYAKIPVGHVEAGLRTGDLYEPFPEEMNRVLTGRIATFHFAATEGAAQNLYREGVDPCHGHCYRQHWHRCGVVRQAGSRDRQTGWLQWIPPRYIEEAHRRHSAPPRKLWRRLRSDMRGTRPPRSPG